MNKIRNFRQKSPSINDDSTSTNQETVGMGIFNKIKRYSHVSNKLVMRRANTDLIRKHSPHRSSSGSYDMTGNSSRDLRPEIGAPVLITTTTLDVDKMASCQQKSPKSPIPVSSDSDTDVFTDAANSIRNFGEIKFSFFPNNDAMNSSNFANLSTSTDEGDYEVPPSPKSIHNYSFDSAVLHRFSENELSPIRPPLRKNKSKSASNLHKSEQKCLTKAVSSGEFARDKTDSVGADDNHSDKENSSDWGNKNQCSNTTIKQSSVIIQKQAHVADIMQNSVNNYRLNGSESDHSRTPTPLVFDPCNERNYQSEESLNSNNSRSSLSDDFDLKSASFESLQEARNLVLSIEELNELTRQINESEDFNNEIDLEYCEHRNKLKPTERRITLLRNKNQKINLHLDEKKEQLSHAWTGIKSWIDEEKMKLKEVVHRHAAMQRVGALKNGKKGSARNSVERSDSMASSLSRVELSDNESDLESLAENKKQVGSSSRSRQVSEEREIPTVLSAFMRKPKPEPLEGQNGFEELRRYVKQGGDFGKDLMAILQERVDSETLYAKSLSKMASKLNKACREIPGSVAEAWRGVATEMESRSEVHRQFSSSLSEEIVKPLKVILDNQHKARKTVETTVDKSVRLLGEWRASEAKAKKASHAAARENEKLQDALLDVRISRTPSISILHPTRSHRSPDKETGKAGEKDSKLDSKRRKAEDAVKRADVEYYTLCVRAERARVDWEMAVLRGSSVLQSLESQRLSHMKTYVTSYLKLSTDMNPVLDRIVDRLAPIISTCNVQKDIGVIKNIRRASEGPSEQLLPDFYCEHTTLAMNRERRKQALVKLLQLVRQDLERERKSRNGLKGFSQQINNADNQNVTDKLYHIRSMLTYLEGARYKLQSALMELDHKPRGSHPLAPHIQITRDRTGLQQSVLKVPLWLKNNENEEATALVNGEQSRDDRDQFLSNESSNGDSYSCDIKNDAVIKQYSKPYNRSKSSVELSHSLSSQPLNSLSSTNHNTDSESTIIGNGDKENGTVKLKSTEDSPIFDRGIADGGSNQHDSDFDEFSSHDEEEDIKRDQQQQHNNVQSNHLDVIGRCRALYNYSPKLYDELELTPGDVIEIHTKQEDGWWLGALNNRVGIFPATYVEEMA